MENTKAFYEIKLDEMESGKAWWPDIFDKNDISGHCDAKLCADALVAWGNVRNGHPRHPNFGMVLVKIGVKLGFVATEQNLTAYANDFLKNSNSGSVQPKSQYEI